MKPQHAMPDWAPHGPNYKLLAQFGFADLWVQVAAPLDPDYHIYGLVLSDADRFWFSTVKMLMDDLEDQWLGHMPEGFEDWIAALVTLREAA